MNANGKSPTLFDRSTFDAFEVFWASYPRKVGKGAARKAYVKVINSGLATAEILLNAVQAYSEIAQLKEMTFVPHPSTWLNQERWSDDLEAERIANGPRLASADRRGDERQADLGRYFALTRALSDD